MLQQKNYHIFAYFFVLLCECLTILYQGYLIPQEEVIAMGAGKGLFQARSKRSIIIVSRVFFMLVYFKCIVLYEVLNGLVTYLIKQGLIIVISCLLGSQMLH